MNDSVDSTTNKVTQKKVNLFRRIFRGIASMFRFLRVSVANILLVIFLVLIFGFLFSGPTVTVEPDSVLVFEPNQSFVEKRQNTNPLFEILFGSTGADVTDIHEVIATLHHAAENPRILALEIRPESLGGISLVHLDMIGEALQFFSETGKPIYAYSGDFAQSAYLLSTYADAVYLNPLGSLSFSGIAFESMYYKAILDKFDINVHIFRTGDYKSAVEPFIQDAMSDVVRNSYRPIVDQLWDSLKSHIVLNRELDEASVDQFTENFAEFLHPTRNRLAEIAVEQGFVDELVTSDALSEVVQKRFGMRSPNQSISRISTEDYFSTIEEKRTLKIASTSPEDSKVLSKRSGTIAVITVEGTIFGWSGEESAQLVDSTGAVEHIQHAINEKVDAIVLRVNSPGGSVIASEAIRLRVEAAQNHKIPVVVSMSGTAASGGYWISAGADRILASDSTITGSIGVFSMIPSAEDLLQRIGISNDGVYSSDGHFRVDPAIGISESEARMLQASVDDAYSKFLEIVSTGRDIPVNDLKPLAGGRIWTGRQALANGLIDQLGDYDDAIDVAAKLAGLKSYYVERYGFVKRPPFMNLLAQASSWFPQIAPQSQKFARRVQHSLQDIHDIFLIEPRKVYAFCEFCPDF